VTSRDIRRALVGLVVLAAALRLWRIGHQSYWLDEAFTVGLVNEDFVGMLKGVRETESTPHLFYTLAWLWEKVVGDGEAALRSLSALVGTATVPVAYLAARELFKPVVALTAAALVAVNPWLVWYSQEARAYALLVLLATAALLFFLRARSGDRRSLALWALFSALAVLTHYFAAFMVAPMGLWLIWTRRERAPLVASGAVAAVGVALAPLALDQRASGHTKFIESIALGDRVSDLPKKFVTGELGTPTPGIGAAAGLLVMVALTLLVARAPEQDRTRALGLAGLVAVTLAVPLLLAVAGFDYLFPRNAIAAFVPAAIALAAGFATSRVGLAAAAALCVIAVAVNIQVSFNESLQRDDFRGLAKALGQPEGDRAIVISSQVQLRGLEQYAGPLPKFPPSGVDVYEVDAVLITRDGIERQPQSPGEGFELVERRGTESWQLVRFRAVQGRQAQTGGPVLLGVDGRAAEATRLEDEVPTLRLQSRR
jgi:4-amino-4-deoxy-L-arabinose transferase-like glycosyltransferase